jgi:hypothetical protein
LAIKAGTTLASGAIRRTDWKDTATQIGIDVGSAWLAGKIPGVQGTQGAVQAGFSQGISAGTRAILSEGVKGAVRGAVQEGVSSAAGQQLREGEIDYKEVGKAATRGAVSGFVAPTVAAGVDWLSAVPAPGDQSPISGTGRASLPGSTPAPGDPTGQIVDLEGIKGTPRTAQVPSPPAFDIDAFTPPAPEAPAAPAPADSAPVPEAPAKPGEVTSKDILDEMKRSGKANEDFRERQLYWTLGVPTAALLIDSYLGYRAGKSQEDALEQAQRDRDRAYQEHRDMQSSVAEQYFSSVRENTVPDWGVSGRTVWS